MVFTYQAITANCGNNDFGPGATQLFCDHINQNLCDFYVLNLQEAQYNIIEQTLTKQLGEKYAVIKCASMDTITNIKSLSSYINNVGEGIASILIYDKSKFTHTIDKSEETRRFTGFSDNNSEIKGYNKGGTCSIVTLTPKNEPHEPIKLQIISGHLDANSSAKRAKDWQNIQELASIPLTEKFQWDDLISSLPNLRISGMDCNTRDLNTAPNSPIWNLNHEEIQGFNQFPLGNLRYSSTQTYVPKKNNKLQEKIERYNSQGYTLSGSLDVNEILHYQPPVFKNLDIESSLILDPDENHPRDHKIIITPILEVEKLNEFEHVKHHLHILLKNASPIMANQILQLEDSLESRQILLDTFRMCIAKDGILFKMQNLYQQKLEFINSMNEAKRSPFVINQYKERFFSSMPWLADMRLENMSAQVTNIQSNIQTELEFLENPPVIRSLDELKKECCGILKRYHDEKNLSFSSYFSTTKKQSIKREAIQILIGIISGANSIDMITNSIIAVKRNRELFVRSSEDGTNGLLSQLIQECEDLIASSNVLVLEGEELLPNLKKWLINKLDSYSMLPRDNSIANAASIEKKIQASHELISIVQQCSNIEDLFKNINLYKTQHRADLFKKSSGKFASIIEECNQMIANFIKPGPSLGLKK